MCLLRRPAVAYLRLVRRMSEWTALSQFLLNAVCFAAIGCVLGILCRTRILLALLLSVPVSIGGLMLGAWWAGTFSNQFSLQDPGGTVYWIGVPYLLFCFLPTAGAALFVTIIWRCRMKKVS